MTGGLATLQIESRVYEIVFHHAISYQILSHRRPFLP